jgi:hypothetical protein
LFVLLAAAAGEACGEGLRLALPRARSFVPGVVDVASWGRAASAAGLKGCVAVDQRTERRAGAGILGYGVVAHGAAGFWASGHAHARAVGVLASRVRASPIPHAGTFVYSKPGEARLVPPQTTEGLTRYSMY